MVFHEQLEIRHRVDRLRQRVAEQLHPLKDPAPLTLGNHRAWGPHSR